VEAVEGEEGSDGGVVQGRGGGLVAGVEGGDEVCGEGGFSCKEGRVSVSDEGSRVESPLALSLIVRCSVCWDRFFFT
jgi:hypothetical protein